MVPLQSLANHAAHGLWRCLPRELRRRGLTGISSALARKPDAAAPAISTGVIIGGETESANGLGELARLLHQGASILGKDKGLMRLGLPGIVASQSPPEAKTAALLAVVNAPYLPTALLRVQRGFLAGRRVIGYWAWELEKIPESWKAGTRFVHEIWAPSAFTASAFEEVAPGRVRTVLPPLAASPMAVEGTRADFELEESVFTVTVIFNLASSMERKNPLGAISAFKLAFQDSPDHLLILKLTGVEKYESDLARIKAVIGEAKNIKLITDTFSESRLRGLIRASNVVLSLHRSEGFGLVPATAMLLGCPVVATGWSGNLGFMTHDVSALVPFKLVPAKDPRGTYEIAGAHWAEPDIAAAAAWLKRLFQDSALRLRFGRDGQAYARARLGLAPYADALAASGII